MFTSNPWGDYITMLAPLIAGYYLFVGLKFYGHDLKAKIAGRRIDFARIAEPQRDSDVPDPPTPNFYAMDEQGLVDSSLEDTSDQQPAAWQNEELFDQVEQLAAHLKEAIEEAHEKEYGRQDLVLLLQMTLKEYPAMSAKPFRTAINNLIETECAKYGSIHLREQDTEAIWMQVG